MKIKSLILSVLFSLFALSGLLAQEKYEYAIVEYVSQAKIKVTTSAGAKETSYPKELLGESEVIKKAEEMSKEGWEVYSVLRPVIGYPSIYYLRKKKNQ